MPNLHFDNATTNLLIAYMEKQSAVTTPVTEGISAGTTEINDELAVRSAGREAVFIRWASHCRHDSVSRRTFQIMHCSAGYPVWMAGEKAAGKADLIRTNNIPNARLSSPETNPSRCENFCRPFPINVRLKRCSW